MLEIGYQLNTGQILLQKSRMGRFFCPPSAHYGGAKKMAMSPLCIENPPEQNATTALELDYSSDP